MTDKIQAIKDEIFRLKHNTPNAYDLSRFMLLEEIEHFIDSLPEEPKFKVGDMVISTNNPSLTYKVLQVGLPNELGKLDYKVEIFTDGKPGIKVGNTFKEHNIHLISCDRMDEWGKLISDEPASKDLEIEIENYINSNFSEGCDGGMLSDSEPNLGGVTYCDLANLARHFIECGRNHFEDKSKMVSEDWEKDSSFEKLLQEIYVKYNKQIPIEKLLDIATYFVEWQKQAMKESLQTEYEKGLFDMQQEMMKDAVEGEYWIGEIHLDTPIIQGYNDGDRIKFVPIKDKQQ